MLLDLDKSGKRCTQSCSSPSQLGWLEKDSSIRESLIYWPLSTVGGAWAALEPCRVPSPGWGWTPSTEVLEPALGS